MSRSPASRRYHEARVARRATERAEYSELVDDIHTRVQESVQRAEELKAPKQITGRERRPRTKAKPRVMPEDAARVTDTILGSGMVSLGDK